MYCLRPDSDARAAGGERQSRSLSSNDPRNDHSPNRNVPYHTERDADSRADAGRVRSSVELRLRWSTRPRGRFEPVEVRLRSCG